ncbi:MAG TPA: thioredoxin domain-containing protein [Anaeromyxobacteraceae bacterium]|nr:thioredoxin domain-containing protein [Anaeromyxobacteraceae bacterium]
MKHTSWILALVVGVVLGVVGDRMAGGGPRVAPAPGRAPELPPPGQRAPQRQQEDPKAIYRIPVDDSPAKGPSDALVTIVESSDFECPFCKRVGPTMKQIAEAYPGKVRFVFKHNPLAFHAKALPAAIAAEEGRTQGGSAKFWEMHDRLFDSAPALDRPALEEVARAAGLDMTAFRKALDENRHEARIRRDQALVTSVGAGGTPTFFVNGRKIAGAVPFDAFKIVVDEELAKAEALVKSGVPASEVYARTIEKGATAPVMVAAPAGAAPAAPAAPPAAQNQKVEFRADDPARGPQVAPVTVVIFSDFQCPFCSRVEPTLAQLQKTYPSDVRVVWKHLPLGMHPQAMPAAIAAEAAREQGKFWEMHDLMFQNQSKLGPAQYEAWAAELKLDPRRFQASVASPATRARVEEDARVGARVASQGTPTLYVNCRPVVGAQPYEAFQRVVDEELARAAELKKSGVKLDAAFYERICDENVKKARAG